eukprot:TRINITY_DN17044_c0_g2_i1.p1 TRINITY_DN17044_c0_g2~~TRINITY_DN17044_c0_g2_i1.p1  ORF type:complete len:244 (-),score=51.27 TRINITY_DN17044_c0_g2_i1:29-721(-)
MSSAPSVSTKESRDLPPGWEAYTTGEGQVYYGNLETGESSWTPPPPPRSPEEMRGMLLRSTFEAADKDGSGMLNKAEVGLMLRRIKEDMSRDAIQKTFELMDGNRDGKISYDEFSRWLEQESQKSLAQELASMTATITGAVSSTFRIWDKDGSGTISGKELEVVLRSACPNMTPQELDLMFKALDSSGDGAVSYSEFVSFLFEEGGKKPVTETPHKGGWEEPRQHKNGLP